MRSNVINHETRHLRGQALPVDQIRDDRHPLAGLVRCGIPRRWRPGGSHCATERPLHPIRGSNQTPPKTMSTPETDSLLRKCHNSYGDERAELIHFCRKLERERDKWREKAEHMGIACKVWEDEPTLHPLTHCPDCREVRGHGHECKSGQDTPSTKP